MIPSPSAHFGILYHNRLNMFQGLTRDEIAKDERRAHLAKYFGEELPQIHIVDVGALWLGEEPYDPLVNAGLARIVGFEPIAAECEALNLKFSSQGLYLPYAIGDGAKRCFHRCAHSMTSSLYEPDLGYMGLYHNLPHFCEIEDTWEVQTVRLDDIKEAANADYLKIDVQGAELDVLRGAEKQLQTITFVHVEVEFVPIYRGQPLFADIDQFLRAHAFSFHRFANIEGRVLTTIDASHDTEAERRQMLWADAVYVRDLRSWRDLSSDGLLRLAVILHELYGSFDFAAKALQIRDERDGGDSYGTYLRQLGLQTGVAGPKPIPGSL